MDVIPFGVKMTSSWTIGRGGALNPVTSILVRDRRGGGL